VKQPACGIATEQRALRTTQNFHAIKVEKCKVDCRNRDIIEFVDISGDGCFMALAEVVHANPADNHICRGAWSVGRIVFEAHDPASQVSTAGDVLALNAVRGHCGDGNADRLEVLFALLCRHDDGVEAGTVLFHRARRSILLGHRWAGEYARRNGAQKVQA